MNVLLIIKSSLITMAFLALTGCKSEIATIEVYDEITASSISGEYSTTGAKLYLLKDVDSFSSVKILSCANGEMTELAKQKLKSDHSNKHVFSFTIFPGENKKPTWVYRYRGQNGNSSDPLHWETLEDGWMISGIKGSRLGRLDQKVELLEAFVLFEDLSDLPTQTDLAFDPWVSIEEHLETTSKFPKIKIILMALE